MIAVITWNAAELDTLRRDQYIAGSNTRMDMATLTVTIDERSRRRYGVRERVISFEELRLRIIGAEATTFLSRANRAARKAGLRKLTRKDIETEIKAARNGSRRS